MNEDIIRMVKCSGLGMLLEIGGMDKCLEHFAKLIAAKCADIADIAEPYKSSDLIKKHFGVEE